MTVNPTQNSKCCFLNSAQWSNFINNNSN